MKHNFEDYYVSPNYGLETLINGNLSECIRYFNDLIHYDFLSSNKYFESRNGICAVIEQMDKIKEFDEKKYKYILSKISVFQLG